MSGIYGLFNLDENPIDPVLLQSMGDAMAYWGPDGRGDWHEGATGLGQMLLHNTPEAVYEQLPYQLPDGQLVLTAEARIDNRNELCDRFNISAADRATTPDSMIILRAYERWGEDCADYLLGDWSFAVWKPAEQRLFVARDHHGYTALYYIHTARFFAFASSVKALLALPDVPRQPNDIKIAQILVGWREGGSATIYQGIMQLPPAHTLTVSPAGLECKRYWWLENAPDLRFKSANDYAEGLLEVFDKAVKCRMRSLKPLAVTLSGGLDSSSIAVLAAREMRHRNKPLLALSYIPFGDGSTLPPELQFINNKLSVDAVALHAGNIEPFYTQCEGSTLLGGLERMMDLHQAPIYTGFGAFWITHLLKLAQEQGIGALFTGNGGTGTISWYGLQRSSFWKMIKVTRARRLLQEYILPEFLSQRLAPANNKWSLNSVINPAFAQQLGLAERMRGINAYIRPVAENSRKVRYSIIQPGQSEVGAAWAEYGAGYGIEMRDPTLDKQVMEYCIGVPNWVFTNGGDNRYLIRQAMRGLVPDKVLFNPHRNMEIPYNGPEVLVKRLIDLTEELHYTVISLAKIGIVQQYIDCTKLTELLNKCLHAPTKDITIDDIASLLRGISVGQFASQNFS